MKKRISFGDINKFLLFPLWGGLVKLFLDFFVDRIYNEITTHPFINGMNEAIGLSLALIPFSIGIIKRKLNQEKIFENFKFNSKHVLMICSSFLYFLHKFSSHCIKHHNINNIWILDIIFLSIFSRYILGEKFYKHQLISFVVLFFCSIIFFYFFFNNEDITLLDFATEIFSEAAYCMAQIWIKYGFDQKNCTVWEVNTYEGIIYLILFLIMLGIVSGVEIDKNSKSLKIFNHINSEGKIYLDNFEYFKSMTAGDVFKFLLTAVLRAGFNVFILFTLKYLTASHIIIVLLSDEIDYSLKMDVTGNVAYIVTTIILYPIVYFSILVFTEVVELNFYDLSTNTRKKIRERGKKERIGDTNDINFLNSRTGSELRLIDEDEKSIRHKSKRKKRDD